MSKLTTRFVSVPHFLDVKHLSMFKWPSETLAFTLNHFYQIFSQVITFLAKHNNIYVNTVIHYWTALRNATSNRSISQEDDWSLKSMFYNLNPKSHFYKYPRITGCHKRLTNALFYPAAWLHMHDNLLGYVQIDLKACQELAPGLNDSCDRLYWY